MKILKYLSIIMMSILLLNSSCDKNVEYKHIINNAVIKTIEADSYRLNTESISLGNDTIKSTLEMDYLGPNNFRFKSNCPSCDQGWYEIIFINDNLYVHDSDDENWNIASSEESNRMNAILKIARDNLKSILDPLSWLIDINELDMATIDGFPCRHLSGHVDMKSYINEKTSKNQQVNTKEVIAIIEEMRNGTGIIDIWIDRDSGIIRRIQREESYFVPDFTSMAGGKTLYTEIKTTELNDINKSFEINIPEITD